MPHFPNRIAPRSHALKLAALSLLLMASCASRADIQGRMSYPGTAPSPGVLTCVDDTNEQTVECPDSLQKEYLGQRVLEIAWNASDFSTLDQLYRKWCSGGERYPDGTWALGQFSWQMQSSFKAWQEWDKDLAKLTAWQQKYPASMAARVAQVAYWNAYAFNARGGAYAADVTPQGWALFKERLARADAILDEIRASAFGCPVWYEQKIDVSFLRGDKETARRMYEEGVAKFPQYQNLHYVMARAYKPKWGGSVEQFERFANDAVKLAGGFEGKGIYSRVYWGVDTPHDIPFDPAGEGPQWSMLKAGFEDLLKAYPKGYLNISQYASVACRTSDSGLYRKLRNMAGVYLQRDRFVVVPVEACDRRHKWTKGGKP